MKDFNQTYNYDVIDKHTGQRFRHSVKAVNSGLASMQVSNLYPNNQIFFVGIDMDSFKSSDKEVSNIHQTGKVDGELAFYACIILFVIFVMMAPNVAKEMFEFVMGLLK